MGSKFLNVPNDYDDDEEVKVDQPWLVKILKIVLTSAHGVVILIKNGDGVPPVAEGKVSVSLLH